MFPKTRSIEPSPSCKCFLLPLYLYCVLIRSASTCHSFTTDAMIKLWLLQHRPCFIFLRDGWLCRCWRVLCKWGQRRKVCAEWSQLCLNSLSLGLRSNTTPSLPLSLSRVQPRTGRTGVRESRPRGVGAAVLAWGRALYLEWPSSWQPAWPVHHCVITGSTPVHSIMIPSHWQSIQTHLVYGKGNKPITVKSTFSRIIVCFVCWPMHGLMHIHIIFIHAQWGLKQCGGLKALGR